MNPFAAPQHDSPTPVDAARARLLRVLGVLEIILGIGFALLSAVGAFYARSASKTVDWEKLVRVEVFTVLASVLCIAAGYTLFKGPSRRALFLQVAPAVALLVSAAYYA